MAGAPAHRLPCLHHGSSPHMRGTLAHLLPSADELRFIPAWAGNARCPVAAETSSTVHPRIRGERHLVTRMDPCQDGSSPHVRGTPTAPEAETLRSRFIPACARNAREGAPSAKNGSVHPRIRGERAGPGSDRTKPVGSSPHARGTRQGLTREPGRHRFILACAGNACAGRPRLPQSAVHPRMCGECLPAASTASILIGSSPHVRGTPPGYRLPAAQRRSIPACAGNAPGRPGNAPLSAVHPRMRGERDRPTI